MRVSLLHATYRAGPRAIALRDEWLRAASDASRVEHVFAADQDDDVSMTCPEIRAGVVSHPMAEVSAVRNWNAAAAHSTGALLVVIADDLYPCERWDEMLAMVVGDLNPSRVPFAVKTTDSLDPTEDQIGHPVVSRRYYERFGLWHAGYTGHFVDNDFTLTAHGHGLVLDGRAIRFRHDNHPSPSGPTQSQARIGTETYAAGRLLFEQRFPPWRRNLGRWYFEPKPGQRTVSEGHRLLRCAGVRLSYAKPFLPRRLVRSLQRFR